MAVTVRANLKDENYFAKAAGGTTRTRAAGALWTAESGKRGTGESISLTRGGAIAPLGGPPPWEGCGTGYCFLPVKVPSPNCPSDTLPLIVLPSLVLPEYFTARV